MPNEIIIASDSRPYKSLITDIGNAKMTLAVLEGRKVNIVEMRLGDGGGSYYMPTTDATALVNEVWAGEIANKSINEASPNIISVKTVIPSSVGGFTIREASLHDDEGDMIAVCNMPDIGKATLPDGISSSLDIVMNILLTNVDAVDFAINPTLDPVSQDDLAKAMSVHNADEGAHSSLTARMAAIETALNGSGTIVQAGDPTIETVGWKGQHYINPETKAEFECIEVNAEGYVWQPVEGGKTIRDLLGTTGNMETSLADVDARLGLLELMYRTQVSGNPFKVTFNNMSGLKVAGVWNAELNRVEF